MYHYMYSVPIVQAKVASTGVVVSSMSLPYRQRPASNLRLSLAPKPANLTLPWSDDSNASATNSVLSSGIEIWKVSYCYLVHVYNCSITVQIYFIMLFICYFMFYLLQIRRISSLKYTCILFHQNLISV